MSSYSEFSNDGDNVSNYDPDGFYDDSFEVDKPTTPEAVKDHSYSQPSLSIVPTMKLE